MASIFFVRCKRENRRFSGAKSRFSRAADRNKDAASRAGELIRGSLIREQEKEHDLVQKALCIATDGPMIFTGSSKYYEALMLVSLVIRVIITANSSVRRRQI